MKSSAVENTLSFVACAWVLLLLMSARVAAAPQSFTHPFLIYYGGGAAFSVSDFDTLAKFDLLVLDRFRYKKKHDTWSSLKSRNSELLILLYQLGPEVAKTDDQHQAYYLNNIGRYNVSRNHPMGDINADNEEFFLLDESGKRIHRPGYEKNYLLDFSNPRFTSYWLQSITDDIVNRPWAADGIMMDNGLTDYTRPINKWRHPQPVRFSEQGSWDKAMNQFIDTASAQLASQQQLLMVNRGNSRHQKPFAQWQLLDQMENAPTYVLDEGVFAVSWGRGVVQFLPPDDWLRQMSLPQSIHHSSVAMLSHTDIGPGEAGLDSRGRRVSFEKIFLYAFGSYQLAKRMDGPATLFAFDHSKRDGAFKRISWFDIYENLDFGAPIRQFELLISTKGASVYFREFEDGFIYVNSGNHRYTKIQPPADTLMLQLDINSVIDKQEVASFDIEAHSAVFFQKQGQR